MAEDFTVRQYVYEQKKDRHPTVRLGKLLSAALVRDEPARFAGDDRRAARGAPRMRA